MAYLALDTATDYLSLAVSTPSGIVCHGEMVGQKHAELTLPRLQDLLTATGTELADLEGIAFASGPGSFTGLRIGCGIVQGLAFTLGIPVLGISTLEALAQASGQERVITCLDARMQQVYAAAYVRSESGWVSVCEPVVCNPEAAPVPDGSGWHACGSGFAVFPEALQARFAAQATAFDAALRPSAAQLLELAMPRFAAGHGLPAAQAELVYLRDKVALKTAERQQAGGH
ncbi:tRNA (adenosine(37)-N6)-threonylcarbamoyltransferase complex dimerization subunit type 1 TsaB [Chitinilyticum piscinae]|uniref:tRNA (Adenosine(37)-N6)-threonylcarbamoyltransferase complex dimerization subunit type 1 TsaB n=1 Tax=Chitinilyticum piscinae TaxID=2866724 RepID=A0A8J7FKY9_9NEIS|nr:tRNA (adenosine(37)-N6)-threonylcarbamoyltransferase complex dimerization subunit type 1 TsaB [Chitinilyticum piscinae]MBE9609660.1 tRNA (adenosine(37)-N6)-threonylcarbamoyltransferase complex dimerization subunit type 1 TsaB [Chitinilyticum piscinae]